MTSPAETPAEGPLTGVRVLDFSRVLAGPHCGRLLVDLGADVIKIEPPEGDLSRFNVPRAHSIALGHAQQNLGKRNISLDLRHTEARDLLRRLADESDVVLENFRGGVMDRLGLGYAELSARNPRLVYASLSGYGQDGPWAHRRAYAPLVAAEMGYLWSFARYRPAPIAQEPHSHADLYAGLQCAVALLAALHQRARTGRGQHVDVAMGEAQLFANEFASVWLSGRGAEAPARPATIASPVFETASGRFVTIGGDPIARANFKAWSRLMPERGLGDDPRFAEGAARQQNRDALLQILAEWVATFSDLEALDRAFHDVGLVMGVVRSLEEAGQTDWAKSRGAVVEVSDRGDGAYRIPNTPWRFSDARSGARGVAAYRGEHNREVLSELLDLSDPELDALESAGVLSSRLP